MGDFNYLHITGVNDLPGYHAAAAFTTNTSEFFKESQEISPRIISDKLSYMLWGADDQMPFDIAGTIAAEHGNYMKLTDAITTANAVDVAKEILFSLDPRLRSQELFLYCSQEFVDKYNEAYLLTHSAIPYNTKYNQPTVEGSNGMLTFCPLFNKADSKFMQVAPKINMLYGYDQMGDVESVDVERFEPFVLSYIATMFFGVQFESIDKRRMKVIELAG